MTKGRAAWIGVALAGVLVVVGGLLWLAVPADTVTLDNIDRVIPGRPLAEVEGVFGRPADEVSAASSPDDPYGRYRGPFTARRWYGREGVAHFVFDAEDRVAWGGWGGGRPPARWYERVAKRFGF